MVDVSQHNLVPEHTVLDHESVEELLTEYDIGRTDLPKIQRRDAALPEDAEVGNVVKIVRDSRTTDEAIVYRLVVE